jgi:hypothetical protein
MKATFPMSFSEALSGASITDPTTNQKVTYGPLKAYVEYLKGYGIDANYVLNNPTPVAWESSACLVMILQVGPLTPLKGGASIEDFGAASIALQTPPKGTVPMRYLKDGWGNPLFFCRWPFNSTRLNPSGATSPGNTNDKSDVEGRLSAANWAKAAVAGYGAFTSSIHPLGKAGTSYVLVPLIVSAGPDGKLGLSLDPTQGGQTTTAADVGDNVYNVDLK